MTPRPSFFTSLVLVSSSLSSTSAFFFSPSSSQSLTHTRTHTRTEHLLSATAAPASPPPQKFYTTLFDPEKGAKLGAFSFAVYGNPSGSRYFRANDGSEIGFQSDEVIRKNFQYLLFANILRAKDLPAETNLVDRLMQGAEPDPVATIEILSTHGSDVAVTTSAESSRNPEFYNARFFLYVEDLATAKLKLTVKDHNHVGGDDLVGFTEIPLNSLLSDPENNPKWTGWVPIKSTYGKPRGEVELSFELVPLAAPEQEGAAEGDGKGPKGRVEELNWDRLAAKIRGGTIGGLGKYTLATFLNNKATDTQGAIWMDKKDKELVICFRGTEIGFADLLTDILIVQQPLDGTKADKRLVHTGFRRAFRSIRDAVYTALYFITHDDLSEWRIDVCGHSLGGALATLMAHDLAGKYPDLAREGRLQMYSYGSPRVGNTAFCEDYDSKLGDASFRVVNNQDVVARVPRATRSPSLIEYDHIGRTVLISFDEQGQLNVFIEGQTPGTCPLRQIDHMEIDETASSSTSSTDTPVAAKLNLTPEELTSFLNLPVSKAVEKENLSIGEVLKIASNFTNLQAMMSQSPVGAFGKMSLKADLAEMGTKISEKMKKVTSGENVKKMALGTMGLEESFVDAEMKLMESIVKGEGLNDHYEDRYYRALESAFATLEERRRSKEAEAEPGAD